jgi:glycerophosphoryl diester phosphodiesterase
MEKAGMTERTYLRIGHRGAAGTRPEHTRAAFERAMEVGVDMIELDVQLTRDGRLVVLHDRELGRTVRGSGLVRDHRFEELQGLDAGSWLGPAYASEPVLSLDDVLDLTAGRAELNVEIKSPEPDWEDTAVVLTDLLKARGRLNSTIVSCFETGALHRVRHRGASTGLGVLWQTTDLNAVWRAAADLRARSVHPHWSLVDAGLVAAAHARGLMLITWTVNEPDLMHHLIQLGVDGIISDFPERLP